MVLSILVRFLHNDAFRMTTIFMEDTTASEVSKKQSKLTGLHKEPVNLSFVWNAHSMRQSGD